MTPETRAAVLSALEGKPKILFDLLADGVPVSVDKLFEAVNKTPGIYDNRMRQQRLGGSISILNRRLEREGFRAVPGEPRGTYRIRRTYY